MLKTKHNGLSVYGEGYQYVSKSVVAKSRNFRIFAQYHRALKLNTVADLDSYRRQKFNKSGCVAKFDCKTISGS